MMYSSKKMYLALSLLMSAPLIAMEGGVAVISLLQQDQTSAPISYRELFQVEKEFHLKKRAEFEQGNKKTYGPADIDADEIDMMNLEASEVARLREVGFVCYQKGSDRHGWLIRALDRCNRYEKWLEKQKSDVAASSVQQPQVVAPQGKAARHVSFAELMQIQQAFHLKKRAEFAKGDKKTYGPADIDADEIEMMELEAAELTRLEKQGLAFIQDGSEFEGWLIRAFDRRNRYTNWLKNQEALKQLKEAKESESK